MERGDVFILLVSFSDDLYSLVGGVTPQAQSRT